MLNKIIEFSLHNRFLVLVLTAILIGSGVYSVLRLPIDAVPDLTNVQVQVLTNAPALGPLEVEQLHHLPGRDGDERPAAGRGDPLDLAVRPVGGDGHLRGRDRHLLGPRPDHGAAVAGPRRHPAGLRRARDGADLHRPGRDLPVRGARRGLLADGAAHDPRLVRRLPAQDRAGPGRGQQLRRRAEDLRGPGRSRAAARLRHLDGPGLRGPEAQQRQRGRRLHRPLRRAADRPGPGADRVARRPGRRSSWRAARTARRSTSATWPRSGSRR